MRALGLAALLFALAFGWAACDGDAPACGDRIGCDELAGKPGWAAGSMAAVPDGFPAAPAGAELCGQSDEGPTVFWLIEHPEGVHDHYRAALTAAGWTATGPVMVVSSPDAGDATCETEQDFTMGDPLIIVRVFPTGRFFSLSLQNLDN